MSLHAKYDPSNIFAKILRGEIPACKVYEDEHILAFMDVFPQAPAHTLVIPKQGGRNLLDTDEAQLLHVIKAVKRIAKAIDTAFAPDGIIISQFNGEAAGQTVFHLHFHILPRFDNQPFKRHGDGQMADTEILQQQAAKIAAALEQQS
ncbi:Bis(5'-nucleosyl)-tetraphosphatase (asymmetrical) [hydrothermal vent metagenome]|uniref:Bis(5'-nucleosyl)-tetraphosphatase (Asymmetrical) n=1 Tax=hydrothermal vent metagenome TaxID=652676 RepID=A0A3B0RJ06_9ZZZZ